MEENKENAYLTCGCAGECYLNQRREELYRKALETNKPEDWGKVPMVCALIDCFNIECLMRKDYKLAMENLKEKNKNIKCLCDECECDECYDCGECTGYLSENED